MKDKDMIRRFLFADLGVRGEWVKLQKSWLDVKGKHQYPFFVQQQLGQGMAAVVLLSATVKFKGSVILQAQGDGLVRTMVAQSTHERKIRGMVRYNAEPVENPHYSVFGEGHLALTIEQDEAKPYQGVVQLDSDNLASSLQTYFNQSVQLKTRLWLFADEQQAAGLFIQELPSQLSGQEDWERIEMLANTITEQEMMELGCEEMLYRLFHEEKVRLFKPQTVEFQCSCNSAKIDATLLSLGRAALEEILQDRGEIDVGCEFCNHHYHYDRVDIENLLLHGMTAPDSGRLN